MALVAAPAAVMAQDSHHMRRDPAAMPMPNVSETRNRAQFEMGVIGPAQLSLTTSQIAVDRARKPDAREFAGFELAEAIAVTTVLKQLGNSPPPMDTKAQATLEKIRSAASVRRSTAPTSTHSTKTTSSCAISRRRLGEFARRHHGMGEMHGRYLATLALATFKEYTMITQRIAAELRA